jgi:hypothetical protein
VRRGEHPGKPGHALHQGIGLEKNRHGELHGEGFPSAGGLGMDRCIYPAAIATGPGEFVSPVNGLTAKPNGDGSISSKYCRKPLRKKVRMTRMIFVSTDVIQVRGDLSFYPHFNT